KKEMEEPFGKKQIGSSAMAYKRNPMRSERVGSLARFVMALPASTAYTASTQWFERTLDDSANKRLAVAQAFLATDAILDIYSNITSGMVVYKKIISRNIAAELPFMITENILMQCVKKGGDRQELHEKIRQLSMQAAREVKEKGRSNNLTELIAADPAFDLSAAELEQLMEPAKYTGRSKELTEQFLKQEIDPVVRKTRRRQTSLKV
ncbi:MAG TPA: adenylosuccinate lyase, partial [Spirochaetota bacterium]|nr:adenylosuccinate lyase [Spirochaetota bacterium]